MTMDETEARARLSKMVAATYLPTLDSGDMDDLVALAKRADCYGSWPSDDNWVPTWDLNAAAREGWTRKAGKVAGNFDYGTDGQSYSRAQMHAHCLEMAAAYRRGVFMSVPLTDAAGGYETVLVEAGTFGQPGGTFGGV